MFNPRDPLQFGSPALGLAGVGGPASAAAAPRFGQAAPVEARRIANEPTAPTNRLSLAAVYARAEVRLGLRRFQPDLAEHIGSARWFRQLGTMLSLGAAALAFWPDLSALQAAPPPALGAGMRDQYAALAIQPLALGADSGQRMGATARVIPLAAAPERPTVQLVATLAQGDSLAAMLGRAGVGSAEAAQITALIAGAIPPGQLTPGTRFDVTLGARSAAGGARAVDRVDLRARFDLDLTIARGANGLALHQRPIAVNTTPLRIRGTVGPSLYRAARAAGAPIGAVQQYLQAIDAHLSLDSDILPGDTFDIIVAYKRAASGEAQVGELLFAGLERAGKPQAQLLRWGSDGQFFEASGMGQRRTGLIMPVVGRITSNFGARRHPILGYTRMHSGIDFGAPYGAPIYAVGDGFVAFAGRRGGHGNYVKLDHGGGYGTGYGHMSRIAVGPGSHVRAGQVIGYVGSTGLSTGPHLHYELYQNGRPVNPMSVRFTVSNQVDERELAAFKAKLAAIKAVAPGAALAGASAAEASPAREIARLGTPAQ